MGKNKLIILFIISVLSVCVISLVSRAQVRGGTTPPTAGNTSTSTPTSTTTATDSTQIGAHTMQGATTGLRIRVMSLDTIVEAATAAEIALISSGDFTRVGTPCPTTVVCTGPNATDNPATCPRLCYVSAATGGTPPSANPFQYKACPPGYSAIATDKIDVLYDQSPAQSTWIVGGVTKKAFYETNGYTCFQSGVQRVICPSGGTTGDFVTLSDAYLYQITNVQCKSSAAGTYCNWNVACGATVDEVTFNRIMCTRPAGFYPVPSVSNPRTSLSTQYYQMAPTATICAHVNTKWQ